MRYVVDIAVPGGFGDWIDESPLYDGIAELWFDGTQEETFALVGKYLPVFVPYERRFLGTYSVFVSDERLQKGAPEAPLPT